MTTLPCDSEAEFLENTDGVTLADSGEFRHRLNGDQFASVARAFHYKFVLGVLLRHFLP